ncbi:MAG TPA: diguanylate cyclase [Steroidobacteraceae bacterium]|nr:diguanylate cyclase [Steroidobacteraceae bacterium]
MKTAPETENWRKKYFDSLSSLESEQRQFRAMEAALKRVAGRLCTAALGQSSRLDEQIKKLQTAIRREATSEELDQITPALTEAIQALDQPATAATTTQIPVAPVAVAPVAVAPVALVAPPPSSSAPVPDAPAPATHAAKVEVATTEPAIVDERIRGILAALLAELRRDPTLIDRIDALEAKLSASLTTDEFPAVLSPLTELVGQRIKRIELAKQEVEALLGHMVGKLDEIGQFVAEQNRSQIESHASSETFNVQLAVEMKAIGDSVDATNDLQQIRAQVRNRIDSIDRHLQEFRKRDTMLTDAMHARNQQMRARITELETEAKRLHHALKDEQRLSTIDALTKIPNRLAYEKRVDDELKRWQRFKQPTCIAVWDVDHFKRVNDTYGHRAGDRVLRTVADCLAARIRSTDFLARYGGEEFVMILPGTKLEDAERVVDEMRAAIANIHFHFRGAPVSITISTGVTALAAGDSAGGAFDRADKALYQAKAQGRNRCVSA